jgi:hypothetical protein
VQAHTIHTNVKSLKPTKAITMMIQDYWNSFPWLRTLQSTLPWQKCITCLYHRNAFFKRKYLPSAGFRSISATLYSWDCAISMHTFNSKYFEGQPHLSILLHLNGMFLKCPVEVRLELSIWYQWYHLSYNILPLAKVIYDLTILLHYTTDCDLGSCILNLDLWIVRYVVLRLSAYIVYF